MSRHTVLSMLREGRLQSEGIIIIAIIHNDNNGDNNNNNNNNNNEMAPGVVRGEDHGYGPLSSLCVPWIKSLIHQCSTKPASLVTQIF